MPRKKHVAVKMGVSWGGVGVRDGVVMGRTSYDEECREGRGRFRRHYGRWSLSAVVGGGGAGGDMSVGDVLVSRQLESKAGAGRASRCRATSTSKLIEFRVCYGATPHAT